MNTFQIHAEMIEESKVYDLDSDILNERFDDDRNSDDVVS